MIDGRMTLRLNVAGQEQDRPFPVEGAGRSAGLTPWSKASHASRSRWRAAQSQNVHAQHVNAIAEVTIAATERENVVLGDGKPHDLLRVEQTTKLDGVAARSST